MVDTRSAPALDLLLAMDDGRSCFDATLPVSSALDGARPDESSTPSHYYQPGGDPNDLSLQGWALIVPAGPTGERLAALVRPLVEKRAADQGLEADEVKVLRVPPDPLYATPAGAAKWSKTYYDDRSGGGDDVPLYQLILGDLDQVPLAIQQYQSVTGRVGRLAFDTEDGYAAYVDKLLRVERAEKRANRRVVVHTAHDGSAALKIGHEALITPWLELIEREREKGRLQGTDVVVGGGVPMAPDPDKLLENAAVREPGVLFTMSHGVGGPRGGWKKESDRRARQGALHFMGDDALLADDLVDRTFMPEGVWFMFACYGAGTPDLSAYQHWLDRLAALKAIKGAGDALSSLKGAKPFVAALPQRALANPNGPIAFVGHVDLAWTYSFQDGVDASKRRPGQFHRVVDPVLRADRVGVAVAELTRTMASTETELVGLYDEDARTGAASREAAEDIRRAYLWMERQDLAGYVLLGDPAARLPVSPPAKKKAAKLDAAFAFSATSAPATPAVAAAPTASERAPTPPSAPPAPTTGAKPGIAKLERAILALLLETRTARELSAELGIDRAELERLADAYQHAGRGAIGR